MVNFDNLSLQEIINELQYQSDQEELIYFYDEQVKVIIEHLEDWQAAQDEM